MTVQFPGLISNLTTMGRVCFHSKQSGGARITIALSEHYPSAKVGIHWPVSLTVNTNEHLEVHDLIGSHHTFIVVVLNENHGLVTWTIHDRIERLDITLLQSRNEGRILET